MCFHCAVCECFTGSSAQCYYTIADFLDGATGDNKQEIDQFLQYVKEKFSEVLLPAEAINKSDFLGKGVFNTYTRQHECCVVLFLQEHLV